MPSALNYPAGDERTALPRASILGVNVTMTDLPTALDVVEDWVRGDKREYVCVCDVHSLLEASADPYLTTLYNSSGMTLADGLPLVWAGRFAGFRDNQRVCGPDLFPAAMSRSPLNGWKHYLLGGEPGVADRLARQLQQRHPSIRIVGTHCPPFRTLSSDEADSMVAAINDSGADILWVALGAPKQEKWMGDYRAKLKVPVIIGVGAAFNFEVGDLPRAPSWLQKRGLEWAFRMMVEPRRLWRRYAKSVPLFLIKTLAEPPRAAR